MLTEWEFFLTSWASPCGFCASLAYAEGAQGDVRVWMVGRLVVALQEVYFICAIIVCVNAADCECVGSSDDEMMW